jgi:uncharacterized FlgJ-related protein
MKLFNLFYFLFIFIGITIPKESSEEYKKVMFDQANRKINIERLKQSKFSVENLLNYLDILEVPNKEIVFKQIVVESSWFKSTLTTKYNNLFGMMYHKRCRETTATGVAFLYMKDYGDKIIIYHPSKYNHWTDSVDDYILFIKYWNKRGYNSDKDYYSFLHKIGYAYEGNYINLLKKINISKYLKVPLIKERLNT